jgi:hypothetical protein
MAPVVLYGALRSGTTMFRIMLSCHPSLFCEGEADYLFDYISQGSDGAWRYDLDALARDRIFRAQSLTLTEGLDGQALLEALLSQLSQRSEGRLVLAIHRNAVKAAALLPEARYLHLLRDPRDVALSSLGMGWASIPYYGVDHWIGTETNWDAASVPDGSSLTVTFEGLMRDIDGELTRVCAHLGLPYDEAMLDYPQYSTYSAPDPRIAQGWRRKGKPGDIALVEGKLGPWLEKRGYETSGASRRPRIAERPLLAMRNTLGRWRFNIRRFGLPLFLGAHAARILRLSKLADHFRRQQEAVILKTLK